jgi:hypothetical protein
MRTFSICETVQSDPTLILRCDDVPSDIVSIALGTKDIRVIGQLANSSNNALLGEIDIDESTRVSVVIKPAMYENPLWDFEWGTLAKREVAAHQMSQMLGWDLVPPTVLRDVDDMESSVQLFIPHDPRQHYFTIAPQRHRDIEPFVVFDYIINNADRKAGHILSETKESFDLILEGSDDETAVDIKAHLWGIDHGVSFHVDDKLRTVVWEYAEKEINRDLLESVARALSLVEEPLSILLDRFEVEQTIVRMEQLLANPYHRALNAEERAFPWPLV